MLLHDLKKYELTQAVYPLFAEAGIPYHVFALFDYERCVRINPIDPMYIEDEQSLKSRIDSFLIAAQGGDARDSTSTGGFFKNTAASLLESITWYLKLYKPECCHLPFLMSIINDPDNLHLKEGKKVIPFGRLKKMLGRDPQVSSMASVFFQGADNPETTSNILQTVILALNTINTDAGFFLLSGNDSDLRSVLLGENGAFAGMKKDAVLWDATTDSAEVAKEMAAEAQSRGLHFVDAPVSGGQDGAVSGSLTVMCGGDAEIIERVKPIADAFACSIRRIGPVGSGQLAKMCNQICIAGVVQGLAEAIAFGQTAGIDMHTVLDVIGKGAASSWQMQRRGDTMIEGKFDFGFAVDWMRKDLGICLEQARKTGADLPMTALVDQFYAEVQNMGGGRFDTSSLILRLNREPKKS